MKNIPINPSEIKWMDESVVDPAGRVFSWNRSIYRAITKEYSSFFEDLFKKNIFKNIDRNTGLIETVKTPYTLRDYGLVVKHSSIRFPSYPFEWCNEMFRDSALLICDLCIELDKYNLELKDAHPYNVMFEDYTPRFIDIGSITKKTGDRWNLYHAFKLNLLNPLYVMETGKSEQVRFLLRHEIDGDKLTQKISHLLPLKHRLRDIFQLSSLTNIPSSLKKIKEEIKKIKLKSTQTEWSTYSKEDDYFLPFDGTNRWFAKQKNVCQILKRIKPPTVLDIGSNVGWYAELSARLGAKVIATDIDEPSLNLLYQRAKKTKLAILPLFIDFMKSSASNIAWSGASDRLQCDMVLALAITHHLVFKNNLHFDTISGELSHFSKKWLIVEFIPKEDKYIKNWVTDRHYWYSQENFLIALNKFFKKVEIFDSAPSPRKLIFCSK